MVQIPREHKKSLMELSKVLAQSDDHRLIREFLFCILTPTELDNISTRWELVKLIDSGMSQRKIAETLGLSLCKITRGSKELKKQDSAFAKMIHSLSLLESNS